MAYGEKELREDLQGELRPVYLLYGEEAYLTAKYADAIGKAAVSEDMGGFNLQKFDGETASVEQLEQAIDALPLMAERKCVIIRDLDFTDDAVAERILPLVETPVDSTVLVLMYMRLQPTGKQTVWKTLRETAAKVGGVVKFTKPTATEIAATLCARAARRNCKLSATNANFLIEQCGDDVLLLCNELDKLAAIADGGEITASLIKKVATQNLEAKGYELTKAVLYRKSDEAYGILDILLGQREDPIAILAILIGAFVDMYRMRVSGASAQEVLETFPQMYGKSKVSRLTFAARDAARMTPEQLCEKLEVLAQADTLLKSSRANSRFVLEQAIAKLML